MKNSQKRFFLILLSALYILSQLGTLTVFAAGTKEDVAPPCLQCQEGDTDLSPYLPTRGNSDDYRAWAQNDLRWGDIPLGSSGCTVASHGCLVTSVTKLIIQCGLRNKVSFDVGALTRWLNSNSGFTPDGGLYWGKPSSCVSGFTNYGNLLEWGTYSSSSYNDKIISWIKSGYHLVLNVNSGGHWVAVDEAKSLATGKVYIMDSAPGSADIALTSRYSTFNLVHAYKGGTTPPASHTCDMNGGYAFVEAVHPHYKCYYCSVCGTAQRNYQEPTTRADCADCSPAQHTCDMNGGYAFVEAVHPHYKCYYCSVCGTAQRNYQEPTTRADCADCYPAQVSASSSSVSLDLCGTASKTITFTCSGGLPSTYTLRFSYSKSNLSMAYGSWYGDSIDVTITGLQQCTEDVIVKLIDSTNNDAVLYEMTVWVYVNDLDHTWGSWHTTSNATCTESGSAERSCTRCGKTETKTLSAIGHNWSAWETRYDANCTDEGRLERYCSNCGSIEAYTTPALGHNYVDGLCIRCGTADPAGACDGGAACPGHDFADMPGASNWAHKGLDFCIARGLLSGTSDTTVSPNVTMNRAMLVTVLYSLEGKPEVTAENPFTDVENDRWFSKPVIWAAANGIVSGAGNGKFNPFGNVTREQIAVMLRSYARYKSFDTSASIELSPYPDAGSTSGWAKDALSWAVAEGLISGAASGGATYLNPKNNATRAQVATILMQFVTKVAKD